MFKLSGVGRGERGPPQQKKSCRKMMLYPKARFLAMIQEIVKNSIFLFNFYLKFSRISQIFVII